MADKKSKTLFIRNLPFSATNDKLSEVFGEVGPIKTAFVVKQKGSNKCRGYGYVKFSMIEDAVKAKEAVKSLDGRQIFASFADAKKTRKLTKAADALEEKTNSLEETTSVEQTPARDVKEKTNVQEQAGSSAKEKTKHVAKQKRKDGRYSKKQKSNVNKDKKGKPTDARKSDRHCRLIIRNLSFKCEVKDLEAAFDTFGELTDISIPTKTDGRKCGFGFVQFNQLSAAETAVAEMNAKEILGRPVAVDWAVPKDRYVKSEVQVEKKDENDIEESTDVESLNENDSEDEEASLNEKDSEDEDDDERDLKENSDAESLETEESEDEGEDDEEDDDDDDDDDDEGFEDEVSGSSESDADQKVSAKDKKKKGKKLDERIPKKSDVEEGRTLFVRNVPFDADEEDLTKLFQGFGELAFTRLVMDPLTDHPKGTAFVQFKSKEAADRCLEKVQDSNSNSGLVCNGRQLLVTLAVSRNEAQAQKAAEKKKGKKDSRNLFLACEGMIRPGTKAAEGISPEDMAKRVKIEQLKRERLKNINIFVSSTRLCFHNLPTQVDDKTLRKTLLDVLGDPSARITECRVMRDMSRKNAQGVAKSQGFAFVNFTKHEHALEAIRKTNNNPAIFGDKKRPIVEFSLENRKALEAKQRRIEKSKLKQERRDLKRAAAERVLNDTSDRGPPARKKAKTGAYSAVARSGKNNEQDRIAKDQHTGPKGLPKHFGPKLRHRDRKKQADQKVNAKKKKSAAKRPAPKQLSKIPKKKRKADTDAFDKLVASYKEKISKGAKTKWFD
ncbi:RNA-binding protein 28-like isoform X5 [Pomacea canaliculata]|uniref:RNA-binding protein 28-like isoform X5 n=1 Tax=Pomacea canaliculata TaxID=400727 RepID=UPI000D73CB47|nr:RNA-binding protein 28-like isoform X5 [Pomacea canaliculata]